MIFLSGPLLESSSLKGANGRNTLISIRMRPGISCAAAVALQERWEQGIRRTIFLLAFGSLALLAAFLSGRWFAGAFLVPLPLLITALPPIKRGMELRGHAIEIAAAVQEYAVEIDAYEAGEAQMFHGYGGVFKKFGSVEGVQAELKKLRPWASKIARRHAGQVQADRRKLG